MAAPFCWLVERRASRGCSAWLSECVEAHMSDNDTPTELNRVTAEKVSLSDMWGSSHSLRSGRRFGTLLRRRDKQRRRRATLRLRQSLPLERD